MSDKRIRRKKQKKKQIKRRVFTVKAPEVGVSYNGPDPG